jgi:hypothetical protein
VPYLRSLSRDLRAAVSLGCRERSLLHRACMYIQFNVCNSWIRGLKGKSKAQRCPFFGFYPVRHCLGAPGPMRLPWAFNEPLESVYQASSFGGNAVALDRIVAAPWVSEIDMRHACNPCRYQSSRTALCRQSSLPPTAHTLRLTRCVPLQQTALWLAILCRHWHALTAVAVFRSFLHYLVRNCDPLLLLLLSPAYMSSYRSDSGLHCPHPAPQPAQQLQ